MIGAPLLRLVPLVLALVPGDRGAAPLVPAAWIVERDPRPLSELKRSLVTEALDLEIDALAKQNDLPGAKAENVAADLRRVLMMRTLVQRAIDPDRISPQSLSLLDKYLVRFALDRLEGEGADAEAVVAWTDANHRFLASGGVGDREAALRARIEALRSMAGGALLRRFLIAVEDGTLDDAARSGFVEAMRKEFPGATIPRRAGGGRAAVRPGRGGSKSLLELLGGGGGAGGAAAAAANPFAKLSPFPRQPGSESLPRLDGVERPLGEVRSLADMLAKMRGS